MDQIIDMEDYKEMKNKPDFVAFTKIGTMLNKDQIIVKANIDLGSKFTIKEILNVMGDIENRTGWDKASKEYFLDRRYSDCLLRKRYEIIVPMPFMQNREFVEKQMTFRANGKMYIYSSSVDDSLEPLKPTLTRGRTLICGSRISHVDGSVKITMVSQMDMKLLIPPVLLGGKMVSEIEIFKDNLIKEMERRMNS
eukprot:TRINITY_DN12999_c0_g1_i5.p1 TRINITY_DN12999_c0_g1~~TRINITY_DN12999_c0_g1_i5.p1  ORF type:complete len:195 (-),score=40.73 TRINITY_DN12999_c0_g1_i5:141-725(-)